MTFTLEDYLCTLHTGQWFGWSDSKNKVYSNLVIHSADAKPTEQECTDGVVGLQTEYDVQDYARKRKAEYDQLNQFEIQFDDDRDGTTTWVDAINEIKGRHPK
jgi:Mlc titration factor MtfA (ptsG expression regulator)